ncbi:MAG TPA: multicopper oxidase domain-containing protein [Methylomirabilota bacterium]
MRWRRLGAAVTCGFVLALLVGLFGPRPVGATHTKYTSPITFPPVLTDQHVHIPAFDRDIQVLEGPKTRMWTLGGTWPPPTIRRPTGRTSEVTFYHFLKDIQTALPDQSELTIHHHGAHVAPVNDGWACGFYIFPFFGDPDTASLTAGSVAPAAATGTSTTTESATAIASTDSSFQPFWRTYRYALRERDAANPTGNERGVTQWYHNHRVDVTATTNRMGLAGGMFIVDDPADPQTLPRGDYDRVLVITDRSFDANNQILQVNNGDHIFVNGVPQPFMNVDTHRYRFRVLNPSVARRFGVELVLEGDEANPDPAVLIPIQQIATDSGLLPAPVKRTSLPIGIAERYEFVIDFGAFPVGTRLILRNGLSLGTPQGEIMKFQVTRKVKDGSRVPPTLRAVPGLGTPVKTRTFNFTRAANGVFTINDLEMDCNRFDANVKVNTREEWVLRNAGGWTHSIHIHDVDQMCVSRNGGACGPEEPFKETWPMLPNETIVVQLVPTDFTQATDLSDGAYMLHCHVFNHEDLAMMTQWIVTRDGD